MQMIYILNLFSVKLLLFTSLSLSTVAPMFSNFLTNFGKIEPKIRNHRAYIKELNLYLNIITLMIK